VTGTTIACIPATATTGGCITGGSQTIAGNKTINGVLAVSGELKQRKAIYNDLTTAPFNYGNVAIGQAADTAVGLRFLSTTAGILQSSTAATAGNNTAWIVDTLATLGGGGQGFDQIVSFRNGGTEQASITASGEVRGRSVAAEYGLSGSTLSVANGASVYGSLYASELSVDNPVTGSIGVLSPIAGSHRISHTLSSTILTGPDCLREEVPIYQGLGSATVATDDADIICTGKAGLDAARHHLTVDCYPSSDDGGDDYSVTIQVCNIMPDIAITVDGTIHVRLFWPN
jgi:hypothetical protein